MKLARMLHFFTTSGSLVVLSACGGQGFLHTPNQPASTSPEFRQSSPASDHAAEKFLPARGSGYSDANLPPAGWQFPYDPNPFIAAICAKDPCSPTLDPNSRAMVSEIFHEAGGFGLGEVQEAEPGTDGKGQTDTFPLYYASKSDPSYSVTCDRYGGCADFMPSAVHIPNDARASIDVDHHAAVIELWAGLEIDFFQFNDGGTGEGTTTPVYGGGSVSTGFAGVCQPTSLAHQGRCPGSGVAAAVPVQPGVIDPREWINGNFEHTIYVSMPCPSPDYIWPAAQSDGQCSTGPMDGERIWLDLSDKQISRLPIHRWAKVLLHEMHDYGLLVVDSVGNGPSNEPWNLYGMDNATMTLWGKPAPWTSFFNWLKAQGQAVNYSNDASHLQIPTTGIKESNIHIVPQTST